MRVKTLKQFSVLMLALLALATGCTGVGKDATPEEGGITIAPGETMIIDLQDVVALNIPEYTVSLKTVSADFKTSKVLYDLTEIAKTEMNETGQFGIVLPKSLRGVQPLLVVVDFEELDRQLTDLVFEPEGTYRPGIASQLTYELMKNYPLKTIQQYPKEDYQAIQKIIQFKVDQMIAQSERLSFSSIPFKKLMRYFTNGFANNIAFLNAIRSFGFDYQFTTKTPQGLLAQDTPEGTLTPYEYATAFTLNGNPAESAPFGHNNSPPRIAPGSARPGLGVGLFAQEGRPIQVTAAAFDLEDDFMDKDFLVTYIPRVLPLNALVSQVVPEPTPEYSTFTEQGTSTAPDTYESAPLGYNEALDTLFYEDGDTAYRDVYYLISDGMVRIPYHWNFKYADVSRQPKILTNAQGQINDTYFDADLQSIHNDPPVAGVPGWLQHNSHCESHPDATPTPDPMSPVVNYYTRIRSKKDGPWSCSFKVIDPDLDDDPNAAPDTFRYSVANIDQFTQVYAGPFSASSRLIWPPFAPYTLNAPRKIPSVTLPTCTDYQGRQHFRCGVALYQITIDNGVKVATETKSDLMYYYDAVVNDRPTGGLITQITIGRAIQFDPNPPYPINFSTPSPAPQTYTVFDLVLNGSGIPQHARTDTYMHEILANAGVSLGTPITALGLDDSLASLSQRAIFMQGSPTAMSDYFSQPHSQCSASGNCYGSFNVALDSEGNALTGSPGALTYFGHSLRPHDVSTYKEPREYDTSCEAQALDIYDNNYDVTEGWDQNPPNSAQYRLLHSNGIPANPTQGGGWVFEINVFDYDNINLRSGEPSDPVFINFSHDIANSIDPNAAPGLIQFCDPATPNKDSGYYETYVAVGSQPAVDPDTCKSWSTTPPKAMQPMPVYYQGFDVSGNPAVRKWVYHRLRVKWKPKDQGQFGKTGPDPAGFIKNQLRNLTFYGNVYVNKNNDRRDLTLVTPPQNLYAKRKSFAPCTNIGVGSQIAHQSYNDLDATFAVFDENQTLWNWPTYPGSVSGRYEVEATLAGTRAIDNEAFLKLVPYFKNCTRIDQYTPLNPNPTPPPTYSQGGPAMWYSDVSDANKTPRIRFISQTNARTVGIPPATIAEDFCMQFKHTPYSVGGNAYNEVWMIENKDLTNPFTIDNATFPSIGVCTELDFILVHPNQQYVVVGATNLRAGCTAHTKGDLLWDNATSRGTVAMVIDMTLPEFGQLPANSPLRLDYFPEIYQARRTTNDLDAPHALFLNFAHLDTFIYNTVTQVSEYTGFDVWLPADAAHTGAAPTPPPTGALFGAQEIDMDNQPNLLALAAPTPDASTSNVFFRMAPGNSTHIQVFVKNQANVQVPFKAMDTSLVPESDPYDVMSYTFGTFTAPIAPTVPALLGSGRPDCTSIPAGYPTTLSTLNFLTLQNYKPCIFSWTPTAADEGRKYSYPVDVQDNYGATPAVMGVGGKYPDPAGGVMAATGAKLNGPTTSYFFDFEALENNIAPYFTNVSNGAALTSAYNSAGGSAGWTSVFPSSAPAAGIAPTTCPGGSPTGFTCGAGKLVVSDGDILQSATPTQMVEGTSTAFSVFAKDLNITADLKTISAIKPTRVFIVDGPYQGQTYSVPSFSSMSLSTTQNVAAGTATFGFTWQPTDAEANYLSNPGGFLIPVVISDKTYFPATDAGFPSQFTVPSISKTIWLWARISVKNSPPLVYYLNGATEVPLGGATLTFQTGTAALYTIRVKDTDRARLQQTGETTGFNPVFAGPAFVTPQPAGTPYINGNFVVQDFRIGGTASVADTGFYTNPVVDVTDPGDPSLGLAINPDASSPPRSRLTPTSNLITTGFNIEVIGRPTFLVPSPTPVAAPSPVLAYAYAARQFYYPLSLWITRTNEKLAPIFIGIDNATAVTPVKKLAAQTGIYVNTQHVLRWPDSIVTQVNAPLNRDIPIFAIAQMYCNVGTPNKTIIRYNETSGLMETCGINTANLANNATNSVLRIQLLSSGVQPAPSPITFVSATRNISVNPTPSDTTAALNAEYADFFGRCNGSNCSLAPTTANAAPSGLVMNPSATTGWVSYLFNNYLTRMDYNRNAGVFSVTKTYQDNTPSGARSINFMAYKNELLTFNATLSGAAPIAPFNQYRWYINGCLKSAGAIQSTSLSFQWLVGSLAGGANNDCTGEYGFSETGASSLGELIVRLSILNSSEATLTTSDSATYSYVWKVSVVNNAPALQTASTYAWSTPITLNGSYTSGNQAVQFALPVTYSGRNFFAFTDLSTVTGLKVRAREFDTGGNLPVSGFANLLLSCASTYVNQPQWIGLQPDLGGRLYISASTNNALPFGSAANASYGSSSQTCFTNALTLAAPAQTAINFGGTSSVPAGYLAFSKATQSVNSIATYSTTAAAYDGTNDSNFYLIDKVPITAPSPFPVGAIGIRSFFWSYPLTALYSPTPTPSEMNSPFQNNDVRRNIVSGNHLFQFFGSKSAAATNWRGFILHRTLTAQPAQFAASTAGSNRIMFASPTTGTAPTPSANDCQFDGTPLDGIYIPSLDTLFVLAWASDATGMGHIVSITNATTAPKCNLIGDVVNPSLSSTDHNPNITHLALDSKRGMIYGISNPGLGTPGQLFTLDIYTKALVTRSTSATILPYQIVYSPNINGAYLFDNRRATFPVLYRIW